MPELGVPIVESAKRAPPFDNRAHDGGGHRYLTDPLAETYILRPPDGGVISEGMLPPQEMGVRAALIEAMEAFKLNAAVGFWATALGTKRAKVASALLKDKVNALETTIGLSREHLAAARRIENSYRGEARGLIKLAMKNLAAGKD